ncbi:protein of unknown function [Methylorubrum extorquens]|uniref:Uncharacterized protein n=1 Tax=Methylorubrum extorquens TaxID=408 RepID=A0A2N9ARD1_METEX|nr:protein of unknown function [Methylorubrum extorquens]
MTDLKRWNQNLGGTFRKHGTL